MKIDKVKSLDLFENGNYIRSFSKWKEIEEYINIKYEYHKSLNWSDEHSINNKIIEQLNNKRFHVIESFKLIFKN